MATASATKRMQTVMVEQLVEVEDGVTLELDQEEAVFLRDLLYCGISGGTDTRRTFSDSISHALAAAGVEASIGYGTGKSYDFTGTINFTEVSK